MCGRRCACDCVAFVCLHLLLAFIGIYFWYSHPAAHSIQMGRARGLVFALIWLLWSWHAYSQVLAWGILVKTAIVLSKCWKYNTIKVNNLKKATIVDLTFCFYIPMEEDYVRLSNNFKVDCIFTREVIQEYQHPTCFYPASQQNLPSLSSCTLNYRLYYNEINWVYS